MSIVDFMVVGFGLTCFSIGYTFGKDNHKPQIEQEDLAFKTNLSDYLNHYEVNQIQTKDLAKAFEPNQRFENSDSSDIIFDMDYYGKKRANKTIPDPFANLICNDLLSSTN